MSTQSIQKITGDEYLALERAAERKSEFVDGEIYAMAGGSLRHSLIAANLIIDLGAKLRGTNCRVFSSDARIRTAASGSYVYPDVSVVCGAPQVHKEAADILTNPKVLLAVLSPSTADYDRGKKFELYREIPSLEDYILVHTLSAHVEHFARQADASWIFREYGSLEASMLVGSIGCTLLLGDIYHGVFELPN